MVRQNPLQNIWHTTMLSNIMNAKRLYFLLYLVATRIVWLCVYTRLDCHAYYVVIFHQCFVISKLVVRLKPNIVDRSHRNRNCILEVKSKNSIVGFLLIITLYCLWGLYNIIIMENMINYGLHNFMCVSCLDFPLQTYF